jgi:signal transduction histidine kinase
VVLVLVFLTAVQADLGRQGPLTGFIAILVALFSLTLHGTGTAYRLAGGAVALALAGLQCAAGLAGQRLEDLVPSSVFMVGVAVLGRTVRHSREEARHERDRSRQALDRRERELVEATSAERGRIARELHDVVAHALSVIVVQASVEDRLHPDGPARDTLRTIERQGREALVELRLLLGLLREDGQGPAARPLPSLALLDQLADDVRGSGAEIDVSRSGDLSDLSPGVDLTAFRVVQEALTNSLRHAPTASVRVVVTRTSSHLLVEVEDDGGDGTRRTDLAGSGTGLLGLTERVGLYGGTLVAAPRLRGGFSVRATIPVVAGHQERTVEALP